MKDKIPKTALNDYHEMNAIELAEIDQVKEKFNNNVMKDEEQSNAMLQLRIQELEVSLEQAKNERNSFQQSYIEEKQRNDVLVNKMLEYNKMVDEHLKKVINELEAFDENNASFVERVVVRLKMKRFIKDTKNIEEQHNET